MTTDNHTPITTGAAANASTFNNPMGELDAAIGNLSTLDTTLKTALVAAINEVIGTIGELSTLETTTKASMVAAVNEVLNKIAVGKKNAYTEIISTTPYVISPDVSYLQVNYLSVPSGRIQLPAIADVGLGTEITIRSVNNEIGYAASIEAAAGSDDGIETSAVTENSKLTYRASLDSDEEPKWYIIN